MGTFLVRDSRTFQWTAEAPVIRLGSERLTMAAAAQTATVPSGTRRIRIAAEAGDIRISFSGVATATSPWYVPSGTVEWISVLDDVTVSVYAAASIFANFVYFGFA